MPTVQLAATTSQSPASDFGSPLRQQRQVLGGQRVGAPRAGIVADVARLAQFRQRLAQRAPQRLNAGLGIVVLQVSIFPTTVGNLVGVDLLFNRAVVTSVMPPI